MNTFNADLSALGWSVFQLVIVWGLLAMITAAITFGILTVWGRRTLRVRIGASLSAGFGTVIIVLALLMAASCGDSGDSPADDQPIEVSQSA